MNVWLQAIIGFELSCKAVSQGATSRHTGNYE